MADLARFRRLAPVHDRSVLDTVTIEREVSFGPTTRGEADVFVPLGSEAPPVIVMAHGLCGIRADLTQMAIALAEAGLLVVNATWRNLRTGHRIDDSLADLGDAMRFARRRWRRPVTLVAWSDGALPAAVLALNAPSPDAQPAAFVGLSGHYGWQNPASSDFVDERAEAYFLGGPSADGWSEGNPYGHIRPGSIPQITLIAGDGAAHLRNAREFGQALAESGHRARLVVIDRCDHFGPIIPRLPPGRTAIRQIVDTAREVDAVTSRNGAAGPT